MGLGVRGEQGGCTDRARAFVDPDGAVWDLDIGLAVVYGEEVGSVGGVDGHRSELGARIRQWPS